ncbi:30S ribosomal protein S4 [Candidatus Mycoplasma mahonii]|uniref:30S ribosomal protein S4 n=1 Tax=Candidatus Mycoplasma mahonii TaxID=3004105 RepID=UPI0026F06AD0|nr:30S ribosomal protein S4 [Candidatus Mycoplasma mahonii]WKX02694.1 30S ribosomal protein S4 [Candidatus Mycoplasma mahonii]
MARYTGPTFKKSRRYGFSILETRKEFAKGKQREYAPGQHGQRRVKLSDYGLHLHEKQKLRYMYGMNEKQFKSTMAKATKQKGVAGLNFLILLESRLDNVVYRLGFASTRRQSRQLVNHNHFTLNGKKANIPSMHVNMYDIVELKEKSRKNVQITESLKEKTTASWMTRNGFKGNIDRDPQRNELNSEIKESLIVEYYSK